MGELGSLLDIDDVESGIARGLDPDDRGLGRDRRGQRLGVGEVDGADAHTPALVFVDEQPVGAAVTEHDGAGGGIFLHHLPIAQRKGFAPEADARRRARDGGLFEHPRAEEAGLEFAGVCWRGRRDRAARAEQNNEQCDGAPKGMGHADGWW